MTLAGLWHGANFTFLIWGTYHGALLSLERLIGSDRLERIPHPIRILVTFALVHFGWVLFRSADFAQARTVYSGMFGLNGVIDSFSAVQLQNNPFALSLAAFGIVFVTFFERQLIFATPIAEHDFKRWSHFLIWSGFVTALLVSASSTKIPFLYFQF
tara:strand:- start:71 stop:541 length:471 start_codon:yes stop_codon:yes gene_type:complete